MAFNARSVGSVTYTRVSGNIKIKTKPRQTETDRQTGRDRDRQTGRQADTDREKQRQRDRQTDRQTETDRQTDRQRKTERNRETDRDRQRQTETDRQTDRGNKAKKKKQRKESDKDGKECYLACCFLTKGNCLWENSELKVPSRNREFPTCGKKRLSFTLSL